jgi:hypothetical protein
MLTLAVTSGSSIQDCEEQEYDWRDLVQVWACLGDSCLTMNFHGRRSVPRSKKQQAASGGSGSGSGAGAADKQNKENNKPAESKSAKVAAHDIFLLADKCSQSGREAKETKERRTMVRKCG